MGMILHIVSSRIVGRGDVVGRIGYFNLNLSDNLIPPTGIHNENVGFMVVVSTVIKPTFFFFIRFVFFTIIPNRSLSYLSYQLPLKNT